ncbi:polysaccharide deacetylase family protein [Ascidiimonas sp. W6]|uniref:polysaccharide deacetylase family protein n=1 Tax=Ascidiimonas meishanensis TaxID=3128903 RepID=UPI0030ED9E85
MLLVYTHRITPRFTYIVKHIFHKMMGVEVTFTNKVESFIAHTGPRITYTKQPLQNEFFIRSHDLLFEQGIASIDIKMFEWNGIPCFFPTNERSDIPYDIFAAGFYLLSRYEEYLPHVKDSHGRYPAEESLAFKQGFLQKPVVDLWIKQFTVLLLERFPDLQVKLRKFSYVSVIDVAISHCFKHRGILRTLGGTLLDLTSFRLKRIFKRYMVLLGLKKDPYDNFQSLLKLHTENKIKAIFFILIADYSKYDKSISIFNNNFRSLIKSIADYAIVSLMGSYDSYENISSLKKNRATLIELINRPVKRIRLRYNRVNIPETYKLLVDAEFNEDYTMGYTRYPGFRAGTCTPFYFYDISYEVQLPLKINPFCIHNYSFLQFRTEDEIRSLIARLFNEVRNVKGDFITVFSNSMLGNSVVHNNQRIYEELIKTLGSEKYNN